MKSYNRSGVHHFELVDTPNAGTDKSLQCSVSVREAAFDEFVIEEACDAPRVCPSAAVAPQGSRRADSRLGPPFIERLTSMVVVFQQLQILRAVVELDARPVMNVVFTVREHEIGLAPSAIAVNW